jgi:hypothetical protein
MPLLAILVPFLSVGIKPVLYNNAELVVEARSDRCHCGA